MARFALKNLSRGGGGNGNARRGFHNLRRLIAPIFAVFFAAAIFAIPANAQEATGTAYTEASGTFVFFTNSTITLSDPISAIIPAVRAPFPDANSGLAGNVFVRSNATDGNGQTANPIQTTDTEVTFPPDEPLKAGDMLHFINGGISDRSPTLLVYLDGTDLRLAMTMTLDTRTDADGLNANQFFLTTLNVRTQTPSSDIFGYVAPDCVLPMEINSDGSACESPSESGSGDSSSGSVSSTSGDNDSKDIATGMLAVALFAFAVLGSGGDADAFSFTPDFGYAINESGYSYNYGTRLDFAENNWRLYWTAGQANRDGDFGEFRYASGGEYRSDSGLWTIAFSESVQGDVANYNFALSADYDFVSSESLGGGVWSLSPTYRFNSVLDWAKEESDSHNSLNIESVLQMNRWTIRPTAGFNWRRIDEFGNSARFGISAVHRF